MQPPGSVPVARFEEPKGLQEGAKMEPKSPDLGFGARGLRDFSRGLRDFGENPEGPAPRTDFGAILGPPLGPVWGHVGYHFFDVFLRWLFDGFGLHLGSQNTSKMRPKRVPKTHLIKK